MQQVGATRCLGMSSESITRPFEYDYKIATMWSSSINHNCNHIVAEQLFQLINANIRHNETCGKPSTDSKQSI